MPKKLNFCEDWTFTAGFEPEMAGQHLDGDTVRLPHTAIELPFDYFDERSYQKPFTYQKKLQWSDTFKNKEINLLFDGVMANASVYLNGTHIAGHKDGYTPFEVRLTEAFREGECLITVCVDGTENPEIPPFGGRIDYLTYAGIYREAWLQIADSISIKNVKIETRNTLSDAPGVEARIWLSNPSQTAIRGQLQGELVSPDGKIIATCTTDVITDQVSVLTFENLENISLWDLDKPDLYALRLALRADGSKDNFETFFGFRTAEFTPEGFLLNGRKVKLIGLNRHQSFPYSGYAQGRASQERDAQLLKEELGCNIVRTSHYPQSPWFLDHCDRIGLLVLEETPGWQHIGGEAWKDEAVRNVRRMIERDWNHPSIVLWGVRINESPDDDAFYQRTNTLARELDGTRQTGGIRKDTESSLLEDVYTFNDFVLGSFEDSRVNRPRTPLRDQKETTGLSNPVPYLVTEYNGHMYPTKIFDQEQRQIEHVTRHLEILNAAYGDDAVSGCIGWCMFDYNTHQDFGSGDRVCYHGVMTMFREMKLAGHAYASQMSPDRKVILEPVSIWARGERNIGGTLPLMVLSNCDEIRMTYSNGNSFEIFRDRKNFPHLPHPPFCLPLSTEAEDALGVWGHDWPDVEFIGYLNGEVAVRRKFVANPLATELRLEADRVTLNPDHYETRVLAKALDQVGNPLAFLNDSISIELDGPIELIGPTTVAMRGGGTGFWVRAQSGQKGRANISVKTSRFPERRITLQVE